MASSPTNIAAASRLFSPGLIREMASEGRSPMFARLVKQSDLLGGLTPADPVSLVFESAFKILRRPGVRNEYIYRSALTRNVLLGKHSLSTASMLTEFRAGSSKADLVILNGTSTVYEIKSDRDSLARLSGQLENYRKVFSKIYVIAGENHINDLLRCVSPKIGVMALVRWNRISTVREAEIDFSGMSPISLFESLRASEATDVLKGLGCEVPCVPNTLRHEALKARFESLDVQAVHDQMVLVLKKSRNLVALSELLDGLPDSLKAAALSVRFSDRCKINLLGAVNTSLKEAEAWV
ncbi:MAG: sce7726 family protein [Proteobacteria bacterium]|uniref:sce7726 family protein n=1 Tax=Aquabacterium sp. TaxID=1872578 RepID=UPI0035C73E95|nr:sce7726 family protein [Pseudomonadota bacterium]